MPLGTVDAVVNTTVQILGDRTRRLTNGEVGISRDWIIGHHRIFARNPDFEEYVHVENADPRTPAQRRRRFRLKRDAKTPSPASLGPTGYVEDAQVAYALIARLKAAGKVDEATRLLVAIPTPYAVLNFAVDKRDFPAMRPVYERYLLDEVAKIAALLPRHELAIQWDVAHEFEYLATSSAVFNAMTREEMVATLIRLGRGVPADVELGYHCCYGNLNLKHFVEPIDMSAMVDVMNAVSAGLGRPVAFIHMPVPIERVDDAYFAPLRELKRGPETELYLGLAHDRDGVPGTLQRAAAAGKGCWRLRHFHRVWSRNAAAGQHPPIAANPGRGRRRHQPPALLVEQRTPRVDSNGGGGA
jgi:hypothetical protein